MKFFGNVVFYVFVFYVTWPHVFAVYTASVDVVNYPAAYMYAFLAPLQGFNNFLVNVRLRVVARARDITELTSSPARLSLWSRFFPSKAQQEQLGDPTEESFSRPTLKQGNDKNTTWPEEHSANLTPGS